MQLKKIKLSGFKSFVDPTSISFDTNLTGVVGPNGCGKSNIIDAVRWVMGGTSRQLRGDCATDVIFSGSQARKPVGQAAVELIFDNSSKKLLGKYASYSEISIKRVVNRDGVSKNFINGTRCRQRDIQDLFLGTGLSRGSQYTIIGQGTISKFIEAKPEEIRVYIEEAAGISKYKERRRETENSIRHTRENLERLNDIVTELERSLVKLDKQAEDAKKYRALKDQEQTLELKIAAISFKNYQTKREQHSEVLKEYAVNLEKLNAAKVTLVAKRDEGVVKQENLGECLAQEQAKFYEITANISTTEKDIAYKQEESKNCEKRVAELSSELATCNEKSQAMRDKLQQAVAQEQEIIPQASKASADTQQSLQEKQRLEKVMEGSNSGFQDMNNELLALQRSLSTVKEQILKKELALESYENLLTRFLREEEEHQGRQQGIDLSKLRDDLSQHEQQIQRYQSELQQAEQQYKNIQQQAEATQQQLNQQQQSMHQMRGKLESLLTLQQSALGEDNKDVAKWLDKNGVANYSYLAEHIKVDSGWDLAVEQVLSNYLDAICIEDITEIFNKIEGCASGAKLIDVHHAAQNKQSLQEGSLAAKVQAPPFIMHLVANIFCCHDVAEAQQKLQNLEYGATCITQDGVWLGHNWVITPNSQDNVQQGILVRKKHIEGLQADLQSVENEIQQLAQTLQENKEQQTQAQQKVRELQSLVQDSHKESSVAKSQLASCNAELSRIQHKLATIQQERSELLAKQTADKQELSTMQAAMADLSSQINDKQSIVDELAHKKAELSAKYHSARSLYERKLQAEHQILIKKQELANVRQNHTRDNEYLQQEIQKIKENIEQNNKKQQALVHPLDNLVKELEMLLAKRDEQSKVLKKIQEKVSTIQHEQSTINQEIDGLEKQLETVRANNEAKNMELARIEVKMSTILEEFTPLIDKFKEVLKHLADDEKLASFTNDLNSIKGQLKKLGEVNLTAIKEYQEQQERAKYLSAQIADLESSLETLEVAIKKIDRETKTRFQATFDEVNQQFKHIFPSVFEGGKANLELTGDDLLEAGVKVTAEPPGKRNTSIHLLSGGEKALTAIALIFAIFQLNPAPFCMLDEVDAPLDDTNVARYCRLVTKMSKDIQFIFITHNKVTMNMAKHLMGITMGEPGVSQIVSVDVAKAAAMAES